MKVKYLSVKDGRHAKIESLPNFRLQDTVRKMREFYGKDVLLVRSGSRIYNVTAKPEIYEQAH